MAGNLLTPRTEVWRTANGPDGDVQFRGPYFEPRPPDLPGGGYEELTAGFVDEHGGYVIIQQPEGGFSPVCLGKFHDEYDIRTLNKHSGHTPYRCRFFGHDMTDWASRQQFVCVAVRGVCFQDWQNAIVETRRCQRAGCSKDERRVIDTLD